MPHAMTKFQRKFIYLNILFYWGCLKKKVIWNGVILIRKVWTIIWEDKSLESIDLNYPRPIAFFEKSLWKINGFWVRRVRDWEFLRALVAITLKMLLNYASKCGKIPFASLTPRLHTITPATCEYISSTH